VRVRVSPQDEGVEGVGGTGAACELVELIRVPDA
jgi:hypothetical protein